MILIKRKGGYNMAEFKDILSYLRRKNNMSQTELARKLNLSSAAVSNYEKGVRMPDVQTLGILAEIFGVSMEFLTGKEDGSEIKKIGWDMALHPDEYVSEKETEISIALSDRNDFIVEMIRETADFDADQMRRVIEYAKALRVLMESQKGGK